MTPQISNRDALLEGALRCIEEKGYGEITTRDIAAAANANIASIAYHFGSKDALVVEALAEGFRRWFEEFAREATMDGGDGRQSFIQGATRALQAAMGRHRGLAQAFVTALSRAPHEQQLRRVLAASYRETRASMAGFLGLGDDESSQLQAGVLIAIFDGLLIQWLIDPIQGKQDLTLLPAMLDAWLQATPRD
jgi:AcrR family transcriptional regulator